MNFKAYILALTACCACYLQVAAADYYVDASATASTEDGTMANPYKSMATVNANMYRLSGGGNLYFKKGQTFTGTLNVYFSGTAANPITISSYGTAATPPLLVYDLADMSVARTNRKIINLSNVSNIVIDGIDLDDPTIADAAHSSVANVAYGIYSYHSNHCRFTNLHIARVGVGIAIEADYNLVEKCTLQNMRMIVNDAAGSNDDYGALGVLLMGSYNTVINNTIRDCWGVSNDYNWDGGAVELYGVGAAGTSYNTISYNTAVNNEGWMELGAANNSPVTNNRCAYNLLINNGRLCWLNLGGAFASIVSGLEMYNNCIVETQNPRLPAYTLLIGCSPAAGTASTILLKNNIFWVATPAHITDANTNYFPANTLVHENNIYRLGSGTLGYQYVATPSEALIESTTTLFTNHTPLNPENWDYYPVANGLQINFGQDVSLTSDYAGRSVPAGTLPDAGILEYNAALPVVFTQLNAVLRNHILQVSWATASEQNNSYFIVQASANGKDFKEIGHVVSSAADGNSTTPLQYHFSKNIDMPALQSGFGMPIMIVAGAAFIIFWLLLLYKKNKNFLSLNVLLVLLCSGAIAGGVACNKKEVAEINTMQKMWVRIVQVDKDGTSASSKVVQAVRE